MSDKVPMLLDTDPGNDIDDAVAISYLLRQPRCALYPPVTHPLRSLDYPKVDVSGFFYEYFSVTQS
jgi:hypothetical protein